MICDISDRELEVLEYVAEGHTNFSIGCHMGISERTVKNHISNILDKCGAISRTGAVLMALQTGLLDLHSLCAATRDE